MENKVYKYPEIGQYRNAIHAITNTVRYFGKDENGDPIYNDNPLPSIRYRFTPKSHGCFEKNTLVTLANGEYQPISEIQIGMNVLCYDIEENKIVTSVVSEVFCFNSDKDWVELKFDDRVIKCTSDHKFYTKNRGYVEAKDLTNNDEFILT